VRPPPVNHYLDLSSLVAAVEWELLGIMDGRHGMGRITTVGLT
jgi:hypothetical protein